jgi:membrane protease subunit (stomatin/prohibitin family)
MSQPAIVPIQQPRKQQSNRVKKQNSTGAAAPSAEYALGQYTVDAFISPALPNANSKKVKNQQRQQQQQRSQSQRGAPAANVSNNNSSPSKASPQKKSGDSAPVNTRHFAGAQFEISPDANQLPLPGACCRARRRKTSETAPLPAPAPAVAPACCSTNGTRTGNE